MSDQNKTKNSEPESQKKDMMKKIGKNVGILILLFVIATILTAGVTIIIYLIGCFVALIGASIKKDKNKINAFLLSWFYVGKYALE